MQDLINLCSEMEIKYDEWKDYTWKEFDYYYIGWKRRMERNWDYTRNIIANLYNSSGFNKKSVSPKDIMKLDFDNVKKEKNSIDPDVFEKLIVKWNA